MLNIKVERKGYNTALIEWDEPSVVKLYKKDNEGSEPIMLAETDSGIYIDEDEQFNDNNPLYYIDKNGTMSPMTRVDSRGDNYQYHIADTYQWQLKSLPRGFAAKAYLKSINTNYCPECYNTILKKRTKTICDTCDGTGMVGSFKGPLSMYIAITQRKKERIYDELKEREEETIQAWTGNVPYLKQGDIIVFNGLLYVVQYIPNYVYTPSENDNEPFLTRQNFVLIRLDKNNELYNKLMTA